MGNDSRYLKVKKWRKKNSEKVREYNKKYVWQSWLNKADRYIKKHNLTEDREEVAKRLRRRYYREYRQRNYKKIKEYQDRYRANRIIFKEKYEKMKKDK